ncbi:MAG: CaiB/BaiF CoA transferase family protein [Myxococcota bacterium]
MSGLEGVRVLELGELVSAAYATKLMADLGASVVKVEPPQGERARRRGPFPGGTPDPEQSGLFLYLNTNKRGVTLDLDAREDRETLDRWIERSDILVHNLPPARADALRLDGPALWRLRPELVVCSITPFGRTGPYRDYRAEELTTTNAGGWAYLTPGASEEVDSPPLKAYGHQADFQSGLTGAMAALAAYLRARRTGVGEQIDLSNQAVIASLLEAALVTTTYAGLVPTRLGRRALNPWRIFRCQDGLIFLCTIEQDQWERLVDLMGHPDWSELEVFRDFGGRLENADLLETFVQEWIGRWKVDDLYREGQKRRICFAPVFGMADLAVQRHLAERGFFVPVDHPVAGTVTHPGAPYRLSNGAWRIRAPAPRLGEHDAKLRELEPSESPPRPPPSTAVAPAADPRPPAAAAGRRATSRPPLSGRPLEGVRVADLSWVWAGPFCAMQLAHLGADVIKIESYARPDLGRRLPIFAPDVEPSLNASGYFNQWNQGKRSLRLNLGQPGAVEVAKRLIARCDVVVDNFATGVMERLGLGYPALRALRPDLIAASISGYGQTGPSRDYMAYGPAIGPLCGLSSLTGYRGGEPRELGISLGDPTAGITAAMAICAALVARERTGRGEYIDVSLWEASAALVAEGWMEFAINGREPERVGNRDPWMAPHDCFPCRGDDTWISIACASNAEWSALCDVIDPALGRDERFASAASRKAHEDEIERQITQWTRTQDRWEATHRLQAAGVAAFPSLTTLDLSRDPQLEARGFLTRLDHPEVGVRTHAGIPWLLARGPNGVRAPAPLLGADSVEILRDLLGYSLDEIAALEREQILY